MNTLSKKLLTTIAGLTFMTLGCQQATSFKSSSAFNSLSSQSCASQKSVDTSELAINGKPGVAPGQAVQYSLNESLACSPDQSVSWVNASGKPLGSGDQIVSQYSKPGLYVVAAQVQSRASMTPTVISQKTVVTDGLALNAPQVGMAELDNNFELVIPQGISVSSVSWDFGDGQPPQSGLGPIDYQFWSAGNYTVTVTVTLADGDTSVLTHSIQILPYVDTLTCVPDLSISGPTTANVGDPVSLTVYLPPCLSSVTRQVSWDFGDGTAQGTSQTVTHTYSTDGSYHVVVSIYIGESSSPYVTLSTDIAVSGTSTGGDNGGTDGGGSTDPNECSMVGQQRQMSGELYSQDVACGVNGTETDSYRDTTTQVCQAVDGINKWVTSTTTKDLVNKGTCEHQACLVPPSAYAGADPASLGLQLVNGGYYMADGTSKTFYTNSAPDGTCASVASTRSCSNGVLSGSDSASTLVCHEGCPGFGANGTTKTGVITGQISVTHQCQFNETGFFDIFNQVSDQVCKDGQVISSNTRQGTLKTAAVCPTYSWTASENYTACSADCGGQQNQIFVCLDDKGNVAPNDHCQGEAPVVTRACDGNPAAVARTETSTSTEDGGQSTTCPKDQIGVITQTRTVTTTTTYACIDHQVQQASQTTTDGAWEEESFCRDYVPYRCSQDSLSPDQATARYQWMLKCADQVPVIQQFLDQFAPYEKTYQGKPDLMYKGHVVYVTFMNHAYNPERPWIAPKKVNGSCDVPSTAYIAAVCTASCATPEQQILTQADEHSKLAYTKFIDNWQQKVKYVATLQAESTMRSKYVIKTKVDNWVTELVDGNHDIVNFHMKSGGLLRLTPNHPLLTAEGTMKDAGDFQVGDSLVRLGGDLDPIVSIDKEVYYGKVYNVFVQSAALHKNIVVTQGYLNGTAYFQNEGSDHMNKLLFRKNPVQGVFNK